ncbi:MAG: DUF3769 domain-containing protein [Cyanobacteria bacterium P01_A01_bin.105]
MVYFDVPPPLLAEIVWPAVPPSNERISDQADDRDADHRSASDQGVRGRDVNDQSVNDQGADDQSVDGQDAPVALDSGTALSGTALSRTAIDGTAIGGSAISRESASAVASLAEVSHLASDLLLPTRNLGEQSAQTGAIFPGSLAPSAALSHDIAQAQDVTPGGLMLPPLPTGTVPADSTLPETRVDTSERQSIEDLPDGATSTPQPAQLNITADYQTYDPARQVVIARGNVQLLLGESILQAQKMWVNLLNRHVLAEGDVLLTRGAQLVRGQRADYSLVQGAGTVFDAKGQLLLTALGDDFADPLGPATGSRAVFDPLNPDRGVSAVSGAGGLQFTTSTGLRFDGAEGGVRSLRFEAGQLNFDALTWEAEDVRLTNDPFSPPELELRSDRITLTSLNAEQDLLRTENPRLVFDQGFSLPLLRRDYILNRGVFDADDLNPLPTGLGYDGRDRGGFSIERGFTVYETPDVTIDVIPRYLVSNALNQGVFDESAFGIGVDLAARIGDRTSLSGSADLSGLALDRISENLRANLRAQRPLGDHTLAVEYSYRDRLYNGSLGFQDVRSSVGAVLLSPTYQLNNAGLGFDYQVGAQYITAETDRAALLGPNPSDNLVSLGRFQGSARLFQSFTLWQGEPLPPTRTEGLRYTPYPVTPNIRLGASLRGVATYYTSGDLQDLLAGDVRLDFQFGHLSEPVLDYSRFNIGYYQAFVGGDDSPYLFDRDVDRRVLSFGLVQQVYGPFLLGFQTSLNLDSGDDVSTDLILEYSRRTYGILLRYSPTRSTGAIGFRLSDFSWVGSGDPFDGPDREVQGGVIQR